MKTQIKSLVVAFCTLALCASPVTARAAKAEKVGPVEHLEIALKSRHPLEHLEKAKHELEAGMHKQGDHAGAMQQINEAIKAAHHHNHKAVHHHTEQAIHELREGNHATKR